MMYNTRDYWVFGLCPSSGILKNIREHNVSETGSVSFLRQGGQRHLPCWFRQKELPLNTDPTKQVSPKPSTQHRNRSSIRNNVFLVFFRIRDNRQSPKQKTVIPDKIPRYILHYIVYLPPLM
jgi:hypothetical protein